MWVVVVLVFLLIVVAGLLFFSFPMMKEREKMYKKTGKHPKGYYLSLGLAYGIPIGIPLGLAMGNIALGIPIGAAIGIALGSGMEARAKKEKKIRALTKEEKKQKKIVLWILGLSILVGVLAFVFTGFIGGKF